MSRISPSPILGAVFALAAAASVTAGLHAQEHDHSHHGTAEQLGTVHFAVSCSPQAQEAFTRGTAHLHSFGYELAREGFESAAKLDPTCAMAHWGVAMTWWHPLWAPPTEQELAAGAAAAARATELGGKTEREQGFIAAVAAFYRDAATVGHADRARSYEVAMGELAARDPEDHEAAIFHALGLLGAASPADTTFADQKRAAEILNGLLSVEPNHPGIAHYIIHAFDYPQLAELALPAAERYAVIAPDAPHALHMPSHIFVRRGMWEDVIASNLASAESARAQAASRTPGKTSYNALHALDYLVYAYLQLGQDDEARDAVSEAAAATAFDEIGIATAYALAAIPARFALERRQWAEAAALGDGPADFPWAKLPQAEAMTHYGRALGAARAGDVAAARAALARLEEIHAGLAAAPGAGPYAWATLVEAQKTAAAAWLAWAEGDRDRAVELMGAAADLEDGAGKHPVTPGHVLPAREMLGEMLLELGQPQEALAAFEHSLAAAPKRLNGLAGAERAAESAGDTEKAAFFASQIEALAGADALARRGLRLGA